MSQEMQRLICAKELLHICDSDSAAARSREVVAKQIHDILTPPELLAEMSNLDMEAVADRTGMLRALALLFPIEAREELKKPYDDDKITDDEIAELVELPVQWVNFVMDEHWPTIVSLLTTSAEAHCK